MAAQIASSTSSSGSGAVSGDISLLQLLDSPQANCLNESPEHPLGGIISSKTINTQTTTYLSSDTDEQLLINIPFNQTVRVRSIILKSNGPNGPKNVKLFINKPSLGFEDVEDAEEPEAAQVLTFSEEDVKEGKHVNLRFVRFQYVNSIHIFVASNHDDGESTRIDALDIFGLPIETTKMGDLRKEEHSH